MTYNFKAEMGELVSVHYTGTFEDGTVFDSSIERGKPLNFLVGTNELIEEFSKAPVGMFVGQKKKITIQPENAYGPRNPDAIREVPLGMFDDEVTPEIDMVVTFLSSTEQRELPGRILEVNEENAVIDFNHPMAGKVINFEIELLSRGEENG